MKSLLDYDIIYISRINDLDFENRLINIDRQLMRNKEVGYYIETPKNKSGLR